MARTLQQIVSDMLGGYALQIAQLSAQLESAREEIATLKAQLSDAQQKPRLGLVDHEKVS